MNEYISYDIFISMFSDRLKKIFFTPIVRIKAKKIDSYLTPYIKNCQTLLDVGCGDGIVTQYLKNSHPRKIFTGLDVIDYHLVETPIIIYNGSKFPFRSDSYDCVFAVFSLHHCNDDFAVLKEMTRVSRERVIIIEEIYDSLISKIYLYLHDWIGNRLESGAINIPFHFHTESEWNKMILSCNCKIIFSDTISQYPFWLSALLLTFTKQRIYIIDKKR